MRIVMSIYLTLSAWLRNVQNLNEATIERDGDDSHLVWHSTYPGT